ncbi:hypothetical protein [Clostridium baratii]|uniref:hypothetical protein n=1 Tax=Clostridium baratii TaxID=1561 RepID=UPI002901D1A2|nr:hypothetical protein [Clostridium baratii]MDU1054751.1 hypothetical protein [Clostridium baratii]
MNLVEKEISKDIKSVILCSICTALIPVLFLSIYPIVGKEVSGLLNITLINTPDSFEINRTINYISTTNYLGYIFNYVYIIGAVYGGILGATSDIKNYKLKRKEYKDFIKIKIIANLEKYIAYSLIIGMVTFIAISIITPINSKLELILLEEVYLIFGLIIIGLLFMSIGFIICSLIKKNLNAVLVVLCMLAYTYVLGVASRLTYKLEILKLFSPFENMNAMDIVNYGFNKFIIIGMIFVSISCMLITVIIFSIKLKEVN